MKTSLGTTNAVGAMLLALCAAGQAHAGVVFDWQTQNLSPSISAVQGRIEIDASSWAAGQLQIANGCNGFPYVISPGSMYPGCTVLSGITGFSFSVNNNFTPLSFNSLRITGQLAMAGTAPLAGSILAETNFETTVLMSSAAGTGMWTITSFQTDGPPSICQAAPYCSGATGKWVLDASTLPVPEPSSVTLYASALLLALVHGAGKRLRRKAAAPFPAGPLTPSPGHPLTG